MNYFLFNGVRWDGLNLFQGLNHATTEDGIPYAIIHGGTTALWDTIKPYAQGQLPQGYPGKQETDLFRQKLR